MKIGTTLVSRAGTLRAAADGRPAPAPPAPSPEAQQRLRDAAADTPGTGRCGPLKEIDPGLLR
jgi:hypothetical protein